MQNKLARNVNEIKYNDEVETKCSIIDMYMC